MNTLAYIHWHPDPIIFSIGSFTLRWYSILWFIGLAISVYVVYLAYRRSGRDMKEFDTLFIYTFLGIFLGARLGHCLFYEPGYYLTHPLEIFLPVKIDDTGWHYTGYAGLASHGGTLGVIIFLLLFCYRTKMHPLELMDLIALGAPIASGFIRLANLMNSEIIGCPTTVPWAFIFDRIDTLPRHPAQLYEALAYFIIALTIIYFYKYQQHHIKRGFLFGLCITSIFLFRFFIEFIKEDQVAFESGMLFNMGQLLSIPFIIVGTYFTVKGWKRKPTQI